jgi:hypothetical protein
MKTLLITLSLMTSIISAQAFANSDAFSANTAAVTFSPLLPFVGTTALSTVLSSDTNVHKEALQIMKEGQEYYQTGDMGILIGSKVEQLQEEQDMSDDEAVDSIMSQASALLN